MGQPAIRPTVTHQVRGFLANQGVELKPWSGLDETYAALYGCLKARRDDPAFWEPLAHLLREMGEAARDDGRLPAPGAELLSPSALDDVLRSVREALPGDETPGGLAGMRRFALGAPATAAIGFFLLGLAAAGCGMVPPLDDDDDGEELECGLNSGSVLWSTLDASDFSTGTKDYLCACMADLNQDWSSGLTELFETGTENEIAGALESMVDCCDMGGFGQPFAEVEDWLVDGDLCAAQPAYKGVAFVV